MEGIQMSNEIKKKYGQEIFLVDIDGLTIHEHAAVNPIMTPDNLAELRESFVEYGGFDKQFPIVLYHGKIIDGRHRKLISEELNIKQVYARKLPNNMTDEQARDFAIKSDNRRHVTATQKAVTAYKYWIVQNASGNKISQQAAGAKCGSSKRYVGIVNSIAKVAGSDIIDELWNGSKILIYSKDHNTKVPSDSLITINAYYKEQVKKALPPKPVDVSNPFDTRNYSEEEMERMVAILTMLESTFTDSQRQWISRTEHFALKQTLADKLAAEQKLAESLSDLNVQTLEHK